MQGSKYYDVTTFVGSHVLIQWWISPRYLSFIYLTDSSSILLWDGEYHDPLPFNLVNVLIHSIRYCIFFITLLEVVESIFKFDIINQVYS